MHDFFSILIFIIYSFNLYYPFVIYVYSYYVLFLFLLDSSFWKFAYTENISDQTRVVPPELLDFSLSVLDCGKSVKLLKLLSPEVGAYKILKIWL